MIGPLRESLIEAAHRGRLRRPPRVSEDDWRKRLAELFPDATPAALASARALAAAMWDDLTDGDYGV